MHVLTKPPRIRRILTGIALACAFIFCQEASAQRVALKTNALDYVIMSPNLTLETSLSRKISLQFGLTANPINKPINEIRLTNYRFEPELRYWFNRPMARHFVALSLSAGAYTLQFKDRYLQGDFVAGGFSYGYAVVLGRHWNMEAEIGIGIGSFHGYDYKGKNNKPADTSNRILPVPIRAALTFGYIFR